MHKRSSARTWAVTLVVLAFVLAACAPAPAPTPTPPPAPKPAAPAPTAAPAKPAPTAAPAAKPAATAAPAAKPEAKPAAPAKLDKVVFAYAAKSVNHLPNFIAADKGFFKAEGIDADLQLVASVASIQGLSAGNIDYTNSHGEAMLAIARGVKLKAIAHVTVRPMFNFISKKEIQSVKDLKGKAIAITVPGSLTDTQSRTLVRRAGLDPTTDVTIHQTGGTANILAALVAGQVDAGFLSVPFDVMAVNRGFKVLVPAEEIAPWDLTSGIAVTEERIAKKPDEVKRFLKATLKAMAYIRENKADSIEYIAKNYNVDQPTAAGSYDIIVRSLSKDGTMDAEGQAFAVKAKLEGANIKTDVPMSQLFDFGPLRAAQKELGMSQ